MRVMEVPLPARESQPARVIAVAFTHPWKSMRFRGAQKCVKVTTCSIGEKIANKVSADGKQCYRFYSFDEVKWPLTAPVNKDGKILKGNAVCTLPAERLSKTGGSKEALRKALNKAKAAFNYSERRLIWMSFHKVMRTGIVPDGGTQVRRVEATGSTVATVPQHRSLVLASPTVWPAVSRHVH